MNDAAETGKIRGFISVHSVTTLFYLLQKGVSTSEARAVLTNLLQFLKIAGGDQSTIDQSLNLEFQDFEDALEMISAVQCRADYLITRNVKDYKSPLLPVVQPIDFVSSNLS